MAKIKSKKKQNKPDTYHHGDLKMTLMKVALDMLKVSGPDHLSLRELARQAGVSQAAPYRHFASKEELLAALCQQGFEMKSSFIREAQLNYWDDPRELVFQCALSYFRMGHKFPQHFKLMFGSSVDLPQYPELLKASSYTFVLLRNMVMRAQEAGVMGAGDPYHRSLNCWSVVNGFTTLYVEDRLSWLGVTEQNAEAALRALITQYLAGATTAITPVPGFTIFGAAESVPFRELMEQIPYGKPVQSKIF